MTLPTNSSPTVDAPQETRLEDLVGETCCHLFPNDGKAQWSRCGKIPRAEQTPHTIGDLPRRTPFCPLCGLKRCPDCARGAVGD